MTFAIYWAVSLNSVMLMQNAKNGFEFDFERASGVLDETTHLYVIHETRPIRVNEKLFAIILDRPCRRPITFKRLLPANNRMAHKTHSWPLLICGVYLTNQAKVTDYLWFGSAPHVHTSLDSTC